MKIGITYDLREDYLAAGFSEEETAEFDSAETIQAIDETLNDLGHETDRIGNIKNLIKQIHQSEKHIGRHNVQGEQKGYEVYELREQLKRALEKEAYEEAAAIRDKLKKFGVESAE